LAPADRQLGKEEEKKKQKDVGEFDILYIVIHPKVQIFTFLLPHNTRPRKYLASLQSGTCDICEHSKNLGG
jgi:hypothetical protein